jgi:hypothetical protein
MTTSRRALAVAAASAAAAAGLALAAPPAMAAHPLPGAVYVLSTMWAATPSSRSHALPTAGCQPRRPSPRATREPGSASARRGAVVVDDAGRYLYAVNAGSDSITSFRITPPGLVRVDVEPSNGDRPTSVTVDGDLLRPVTATST